MPMFTDKHYVIFSELKWIFALPLEMRIRTGRLQATK
uniref:Uncharacterized protein n=1 Tax=Anguilla anguilla TaxID=7936 RepID=A0A0E9PR15_ANGAN